MSDVQRYLDRAAELDEIAERFGPEHRAEYRSLAQSWREVAARLLAAEDDVVAAQRPTGRPRPANRTGPMRVRPSAA